MTKLLKTIAVLATIWILLTVIAGALVTKTGSGEGCGESWPLCHGQLIPDDITVETLIEYTHRLVTGVAGILILLLSVGVGITYRKHKEVVWVAVLAMVFLLLQSALGALAVLNIGRADATLALHFGISLLSFATVAMLCVYTFQLDKRDALPVSQASSKMKYGIMWLFVYLYGVVYTGAYVRHTGSTMACQGWPLCNGQVIPELSGQTGIMFGHRVAALLMIVGLTVLLYQSLKHYQHDRTIFYSSIALFILVLLQAVSGGLVVLTYMALFPSMLHALFISMLFAVYFHLLLYVCRKK
ncbi:COX15/CtaA family protein [Caldalkalibacillus salinus]|uniref:COX15/CtaA family protein n=1 Tax=Caldalkalibacillus salinus TaxID=2803787 RepID=UPI0019241655|nr:heme A synthase [Caldalkalibacillus salinus]